jgi:mRNA interferase MazF
MNPKPGEVHQVDLGFEGKVRFMIVVSRHDPEAPRALALCVPVTAQYRASKYEVPLGGSRPFSKQSFANVQGTTAVEYHELGRPVGFVSPAVLEQLHAALAFALDLTPSGAR